MKSCCTVSCISDGGSIELDVRRDSKSLVETTSGMICFAPYREKFATLMNPESGHCIELSHEGQGLTGSEDYRCIFESSNRKMFCAPFMARRVLAIDPKKGSRFIGPDVNAPNQKGYICMTIATNGRLYAPPYGATHVLEIDPKTEEVRHIGACVGSGYAAIAVATNGMMYCFPESFYIPRRVMKIDPSSQAVSLIGPELELGSWYHIAEGANKKLYGIPACASCVYEIDLETDHVQAVGPRLLADYNEQTMAKYLGLPAVSPEGRIYVAPRFGKMLEINAPRGSCHADVQLIDADIDLSGYKDLYDGKNGKYYALPFDAQSILEIDPAMRSFTLVGDCDNVFCSCGLRSGKVIGMTEGPDHNVQLVQPTFYPNPVASLISWVGKLYSQKEYSDVILVVGEGQERTEFPCHRMILAQYPYFETLLLKSHFKDRKKQEPL